MKDFIEIIARCAEGTCVSRPFRVTADDGMNNATGIQLRFMGGVY